MKYKITIMKLQLKQNFKGKKDRAKEIVDKRTVEEKIGQMFIVMPEAFDNTGEAVTVFSENIGRV